jgi:hypothetical protein
VSDLAPLGSLVNLQRLDMYHCDQVSDLSPLRAMVNLQRLDLCRTSVFDLAPLGAMVRSLDMPCCDNRSCVVCVVVRNLKSFILAL